MKMFLLGFLLGLFIGEIVTFVVYACIIVGKEADESLEK